MRDGIVATIQRPFARVEFDSNRSGIGMNGLWPGLQDCFPIWFVASQVGVLMSLGASTEPADPSRLGRH
jgi:hypothetical protein